MAYFQKNVCWILSEILLYLRNQKRNQEFNNPTIVVLTDQNDLAELMGSNIAI